MNEKSTEVRADTEDENISYISTMFLILFSIDFWILPVIIRIFQMNVNKKSCTIPIYLFFSLIYVAMMYIIKTITLYILPFNKCCLYKKMQTKRYFLWTINISLLEIIFPDISSNPTLRNWGQFITIDNFLQIRRRVQESILSWFIFTGNRSSGILETLTTAVSSLHTEKSS